MKVDGRAGGGQLLRSALSLSILTGRPFVIDGIRGKRPRPGLLRQHRACVEAARLICGATVEGDQLGSTRLRFAPGPLRSGAWRLDIGSAGSVSLVLQTVILPLLRAPGPSTFTVTGGTHNDAAPPFDFLDGSYGAVLRGLGADLSLDLQRPGFYPAGGGQVDLALRPGPLGTLDLGADLSALGPTQARIYAAGLPPSVANQTALALHQRLGLPWDRIARIQPPNPPGPGHVVLVGAALPSHTVWCSAVAPRGGSAAEASLARWAAFVETGAPVDEHLADQLLLVLAAGASGGFWTGPLSDHGRSNLAVIGLFTEALSVNEAAPGRVWISRPG